MTIGSQQRVRFRINESEFEGEVGASTLLVHLLRDGLGLTGTQIGCDTSACGACTVLVDGDAVKSCTMFAVQAEGAAVRTVEGLSTPDALHPIADAFLSARGLQCGFCTPGMIMSSLALLERNPEPDSIAIREGLEGNLCRCTGYDNIVRAVLHAAAAMRGAEPEALDAGETLPGGGYVFRGL